MNSMAPLCSFPVGFGAPPITRAVRDLAQASPDLATFWRASQRADWMLYLLGWHSASVSPVVQALASFVAQDIDKLPPDDSAARALVSIRDREPDQPFPWPGEFPESHLDTLGSGAHEVQAAVDALARVAAWEHRLGPALPVALANTAIWAACSRGSLGPWIHQSAVLDRLQDCAEHLRAHVPASVVASARKPKRIPSSYPEAKNGWEGLWAE